MSGKSDKPQRHIRFGKKHQDSKRERANKNRESSTQGQDDYVGDLDNEYNRSVIKKQKQNFKLSMNTQNEQEETESRDHSDKITNKVKRIPDHTDHTVDSDTSDSASSHGDSESEEETNDQDDPEYQAIRQELSNLPFEELIELQQKLGTKVYNKVMLKDKAPVKLSSSRFKRENKNRPMEMSSKKPVKRSKIEIIAKKKVNRDPRFDDLSGDFDEHHFKKSFPFLDDIKDREKKKLEKLLKKEKKKDKRIKMQQLLSRMKQQEKTVKLKERRKQIERRWQIQEEKRVKEGKQPFYLKKSDKKKLELADKYRELKKSGELEKYLTKRRKKTAHKEKKRLPSRQSKAS